MLVCKILKGRMDRINAEKDINSFLSSMPLELEDIVVSQVARNNQIVTTIIYKAK